MFEKTVSKERIGIIPIETAGYMAGLESGLHSLGYDIRAVTIGRHTSGYGQREKNPWWARLEVRISDIQSQGRGVSYPVLYIFSLALRVCGTFWMLTKFDQIVLNNGRSLLPLHLDLLIYRARGVRLIAMMGHGSEIRPACIDSLGDVRTFTLSERKARHRKCFARRRFVRRVEAFSHIMISTPTLAHYLRKPYVNGHLLGIPISDKNISEIHNFDPNYRRLNLVPRVVHIPSQPVVKGTKKIVDLCETLEREGLIYFEAKSGLTNAEAIELLAKSDLLVDQAYSDVYMPVLATEAAFLGKPAIVAGYAWEFLDGTSSLRVKPPVFNVTPDAMEGMLRDLLQGPERLHEIGREARDFVVSQRTAVAVAKRYEPLLCFDQSYIRKMSETPGPPNYAWGCGSSKEAIYALAHAGKAHSCFV